MLTNKPKEIRVRESITLLKKFTQLGIPLSDPAVKELKQHLDAYINDGLCWKGSVDFLRFGRIADVNLPQGANETIEVTLRVKPDAGFNKD
jgi:hypothetical protein